MSCDPDCLNFSPARSSFSSLRGKAEFGRQRLGGHSCHHWSFETFLSRAAWAPGALRLLYWHCGDSQWVNICRPIWTVNMCDNIFCLLLLMWLNTRHSSWQNCGFSIFEVSILFWVFIGLYLIVCNDKQTAEGSKSQRRKMIMRKVPGTLIVAMLPSRHPRRILFKSHLIIYHLECFYFKHSHCCGFVMSQTKAAWSRAQPPHLCLG